MTRRMHPPPWLIKGQVVGQRDRHPQLPKSLLVQAQGESDLPIQKMLCNLQQVPGADVVEQMLVGHRPDASKEEHLLLLSLQGPSQRSERHALGIVAGRYRAGVDVFWTRCFFLRLRSVRQTVLRTERRLENFIPEAEAYESVPLDSDVWLKIVVEHVAQRQPAAAYDVPGKEHAFRVGDGFFAPSRHHGGVDAHVVVVRTVEAIEGVYAAGSRVGLVGLDGLLVRLDGCLPIPEEHVDVRRHVHQVPGQRKDVLHRLEIRHGGSEVRGELHQMQVHVEQAWVLRVSLQRLFQHVPRFRSGPSDHFAPVQPHPPGRQHQQRLGKETGHIDIVRKGLIDLSHGVRIRHIQVVSVWGSWPGESPGRSGREMALQRRFGVCFGLLYTVVAHPPLIRGPHVVVVVRPDGVGRSPVRQRASVVGLQR
eukprot:scaffold336_cov250-Pinguiococcus_pyrenoidosus.AAC.4